MPAKQSEGQKFLALLRKWFPRAEIDDTVRFEMPSLVVRDQAILAISRKEQREHLERFESALKQLMAAHGALHPLVSAAVDTRFRRNVENFTGLHAAAFLSASEHRFPVSLTTVLQGLGYGLQGRFPGYSSIERAEFPGALDAGHDVIMATDDINPAEFRELAHKKDVLVKYAAELYERFSGESPQITGKVFAAFLQDILHIMPPPFNDWDAGDVARRVKTRL